MSDDHNSRFGGGTSAYEAMLEQKRTALRQALRHEYLKQLYNPALYTHEGAPVPFDTAMARWHALKATMEERFVPKFRLYAWTFAVAVGPILLHYYSTRYQKRDIDDRYSNLKTPYDDLSRRHNWFM